MTIPRAARGDLPPPPYWRPLRHGDQQSATVVCPAGHFGPLLDHTIHPDGRVEPSVVCPRENCGWHVSGVILEEWGVPA